MDEVPPDVQDLAAERAARRAARDFAAADALRDRIAQAGWTVVDDAEGWRLEPVAVDVVPAGPVTARDVVSVLDEPATADASLHWVVEGWPQDVRRAIDSFRAQAGGRDLHYVVADVTGEPPEVWGDDVEVVALDHGTGWGAARNAGLKRSRGGVVLALGRLDRSDGRRARPARGRARRMPPSASADRSASRRPTSASSTARTARRRTRSRATAWRSVATSSRRAGMFDEKFRWYRTADIEFSFRIKDSGAAGRGRARARRASRAPDVVPDVRPRTAPGGPSGTSTGSSIDGATATT